MLNLDYFSITNETNTRLVVLPCCRTASPRLVNSLLIGAKLCRVGCSDYVYLMKEDKTIPGVNDGSEFANLKESMSGVGINETDQVTRGGARRTRSCYCI